MHANGTRHKPKLSAANTQTSLFFRANEPTAPKPTPSVPPSSTPTCNDTIPEMSYDASSSTQPKINSSNNACDVLDAETRCYLKLIESHSSYRSCLDLSWLFRKMFPDSEIASKFKLSWTKPSYIISHGLAPYFLAMLVKDINASPFYSLSHDESLHSAPKRADGCSDPVLEQRESCSETRYLTSKFFHRPNANTIKDKILEASSPRDAMVFQREWTRCISKIWKLWATRYARCLQNWV